MPAMVFFGRQWKLASDALGIPALISAMARIVWAAIVLAIFVGLQYLLFSCSKRVMVDSFIATSVAVFLALVVVEIAVVVTSSRGSIVQTAAREGVGRLMYIHFMLGLVEMALAIFGLILITSPNDSVMCEDISTQYHVDLLVALVAITELADVIMRTCCCAFMAGRQRSRLLPVHEPYALSHVGARWQGRCRMLCTCLRYSTCFLFSNGPELGDLETIARVFADVFHSEGILDVTASDVLAGMVLLRHVQKAQEHELVARSNLDLVGGASLQQVIEEGNSRGGGAAPPPSLLQVGGGGRTMLHHVAAPVSNVDSASTGLARGGRVRVRLQSGHYIARNVLRPENLDDRRALEEGAYFSRYAAAVYTWMLYVFMYPMAGLPKLGYRRAFKMKPGKKERGVIRSVHGDNVFRGHEAAMHDFLEGRDCEVVYADLVNSIYDRPYAIVVDHKWQCVVVAIRGTLSLEDLLVDANADALPLDEVGKAWGFPGEGMFCHGGILNGADCVVRDLMRHRILHTLLQQGRTGSSPPPTPSTPLTTNTKGYSLRIVGHSLGAGAAQLVALMLRRDFPDLRCLCYGPPGALISSALADYCKAFTLSFVLGRDLVARLSVNAIIKLRDDVLNLVVRCRVNKLEVLRSALRAGWGQDSRTMVEHMLYPPDQVPPSELFDQLQAWQASVRQREQHMTYPKLVPGGHIIYLVKSHQESQGCCSAAKQCYTPTWVTPEELQEVCVASSMMTDHFPNRYLEVLEQVAEEWDIDIKNSITTGGATTGGSSDRP